MGFINKKTYKVVSKDVGCTSENLRKGENVFEPLGYVQETDIGKLCKKVKEYWYVENQEQFNKRTNKK